MKDIQTNRDGFEESIGKEMPFDVPEGYFDTFSERLQSRINAEEKPKVRNVWTDYLKPAFGLIASFAVIFFLLYLPLNYFMPQIWEQYYASNETEMPTSNLTILLNDEIESLSESQFFAFFSELVDSDDEIDWGDEEMLNYLADNASDFEILDNN